MQTNEKGEILVNVEEIAKQTVTDFSRYNGGWIKQITALDKTKNNGYSHIGDFVGNKSIWIRSGSIFLDCSKSGSRKNQHWSYTLFKINADGVGEVIPLDDMGHVAYGWDGQGGDWAVEFWPAIEKTLAEQAEKYPAIDEKATLREERGRLLARISEINAVLGD